MLFRSGEVFYLSKGALIVAILFMLIVVAFSSFVVYNYGILPALVPQPDHDAEEPVIPQDEDLYLTTTSLSQLEPLLPTTRIQRTGNVKEFELEVKEVDWEITPGVVVKAVTYNGRVPGPTIEVMEGDLVKIKVVNSLDYDTSIHWH